MALKYREVVIEDDKSLADSGTETIDLNVTDPITELLLRFHVTNETADCENVPPHMVISKIELVDGGQTYVSLTGAQAVAAACFDTGRWPACWYIDYASSTQRDAIPLRFGRYLGDEMFGFDPRKLLNPQLKVTWTNNALHAADGTTLGVVAKVMEGVTSPPQMFCWKEIEAYTSTADATQKVDLPVDFPYRRLMLRSYIADEDPTADLTNVKLDCDVGKFIAFDLDESEFSNIHQSMFGPYQHYLYGTGQNDDGRRTFLALHTMVYGQAEGARYILNPWLSGGANVVIQLRRADDTDVTSDINFELQMMGYMPQHAWCYQFGRPDDPETWFPSSQYGEIAFKVKAAASSCANSVVIQQPRPIP